MQHTSHIELSESALKSNLLFVKKMLGDTAFSAVVKGNAYGHGIVLFCELLYRNGVRHFSVFSAYEAYQILNCVPNDITIMIMGSIENDQIGWAIVNDVEFYVFEEDRLNAAIEIAQIMGKPAKIHIELETGMNRTGFDSRASKSIFKLLEENRNLIHVIGVCSHLSGAESVANYERIMDQCKRFSSIQQQLEKMDWLDVKYHLACSAAAIQYPKTKLDLARIGILLYGFFPSKEVLVQYLTKNNTHENPLKRVISWRTRVMDVKDVKAGEFVGYGNSFLASENTKIAHIPIGYSNGFSRSLSNLGKVLIRGERFDVVGIVNMNMIAVNITQNTNIMKGDEVVIIGSQGDLEISVSSFIEFSDLVNYELLTRLPSDITRKIIH